MSTLEDIETRILEMRKEAPTKRSLLVGISGIDASGKGHVTARLAEKLSGPRVAVINIDGWLNLPQIRFARDQPAKNFYENGLRLDEMFERLVVPLKEDRRVDIEMDFADETASEFRRHRYTFDNIDIIILEGVFLFKRRYIHLFDLKIWIDCSFSKALERSISRSQEGLPPPETAYAYQTIYFPAQRLHFENDRPVPGSDIIFDNN